MILDRITFDYDSYESGMELSALNCWHTLKRMDVVDDVNVYISTSGRGLHLEALLTERLPADDRQKIRRMFSDDQARVDLDDQRGPIGHATDISWAEKEGNDGERYEVADIWDALDTLEQNRAPDHSRVKAIALHGHKGVHDTRTLNRASLAEGI